MSTHLHQVEHDFARQIATDAVDIHVSTPSNPAHKQQLAILSFLYLVAGTQVMMTMMVLHRHSHVRQLDVVK
jgi:hypothetical protein